MKLPTATLDNLLEHYDDRHGFIFCGQIASDPVHASAIAKAVQNRDFVSCEPEFIGQIDENTFVFVYPRNTSFDMPGFLRVCKGLSLHLDNYFVVDSLKNVLNNYTSTKQEKLETE